MITYRMVVATEEIEFGILTTFNSSKVSTFYFKPFGDLDCFKICRKRTEFEKKLNFFYNSHLKN